MVRPLRAALLVLVLALAHFGNAGTRANVFYCYPR